MAQKMQVQNVGQPGKTYTVDAEKYVLARDAMMAILPDAPPGLTPAQIIAAVTPKLPQAQFPGGTGVGWWVKCVQLDLEAKGVLVRVPKPPVRLWRA
jgi:hypothetical protein